MTGPPAERVDEEWLWLLLIVLAAVVLRLWGLGSWQWEQDELYTLRDALNLGASAPGDAPGIASRPLYYLLQHALLTILPPTPFMLRLPAMLFGIAGIVAVWWLGRRAFGATAGLVAALLVTVSPWHLHASQFARYWTLVMAAAAWFYGLLPAAVDGNKPGRLLGTLAALMLGTLTHPTFLFAAVGAVAAVHLWDAEGHVRFRWPSARAWGYLWGPFLLLLGAGYVGLQLVGEARALENHPEGRGLLASLRLVPAMIQWMPLEAAGAAAIGTLLLTIGGAGSDRRWGGMALAASVTGITILFTLSFRTGVYADYGISMLPLAFVSIGGAIQRVGDRMPKAQRRWAIAGLTAALAIGSGPGVVSHLSDGSRYDYRAAYRVIERLGPEYAVFGDIDVIRHAYAPSLIGRTQRTYQPGTPYWLVGSYQRYGLRGGSPRSQQWLDRNCRRVAQFARPRFDYRDFRVELYWCGSAPVPTGTTVP